VTNAEIIARLYIFLRSFECKFDEARINKYIDENRLIILFHSSIVAMRLSRLVKSKASVLRSKFSFENTEARHFRDKREKYIDIYGTIGCNMDAFELRIICHLDTRHKLSQAKKL